MASLSDSLYNASTSSLPDTFKVDPKKGSKFINDLKKHTHLQFYLEKQLMNAKHYRQEIMKHENYEKQQTVLSFTSQLLRRILIKNLRDKIHKYYGCIEIQDIKDLIIKYNSDAERKVGIDLLLIELDKTKSRTIILLLEWLQKRMMNPDFKAIATIPVMFLINTDEHQHVNLEPSVQLALDLGLACFTNKDITETFLMSKSILKNSIEKKDPSELENEDVSLQDGLSMTLSKEDAEIKKSSNQNIDTMKSTVRLSNSSMETEKDMNENQFQSGEDNSNAKKEDISKKNMNDAQTSTSILGSGSEKCIETNEILKTTSAEGKNLHSSLMEHFQQNENPNPLLFLIQRSIYQYRNLHDTYSSLQKINITKYPFFQLDCVSDYKNDKLNLKSERKSRSKNIKKKKTKREVEERRSHGKKKSKPKSLPEKNHEIPEDSTILHNNENKTKEELLLVEDTEFLEEESGYGSGDSWSVSSNFMDKGNEKQIYKHQKEEDEKSKKIYNEALLKRQERIKELFTRRIRRKLINYARFIERSEIADSKYRPKLYARSLGIVSHQSTSTKEVKAISNKDQHLDQQLHLSMEMSPFVERKIEKKLPTRSARGMNVKERDETILGRYEVRGKANGHVSSLESCNDGKASSSHEQVERMNERIEDSKIRSEHSNNSKTSCTTIRSATVQPHSPKNEEKERITVFSGLSSTVGTATYHYDPYCDSKSILSPVGYDRQQRDTLLYRKKDPKQLNAEQKAKLRKIIKKSICETDVLQYDIEIPSVSVIQSQSLSMFLNRGFNLLSENEYKKALPFFNHCISLASDDPRAYFYRSMLREKEGNYINALDDINKAIQLTEDRPHFNLKKLLSQKEKDSSEKKQILKREKKQHSPEKCNKDVKPKILNTQNQKGILDYFTLIYDRSIIFTKLGYDDLAMKDLKLCLMKEPNNQAMIQNLAILHRRNDNFVDSCNSYKRLWNIELEEHNKLKQQLQEEIIARNTTIEKERHFRKMNPHKGTEENSNNTQLSDGISRDEEIEKSSFLASVQDINIKESSNTKSYLNDLCASSAISIPSEIKNKISNPPKSVHVLINEASEREFRNLVGTDSGFHGKVFNQPTALQRALLSAPGQRNKEELELIATHFKQLPLLKKVTALEDANELAQMCEYRVILQGKRIASCRDETICCFFILSGKVASSIHSKDRSQEIDTCEKDEVFGHFAMVDPQHPKHLETFKAVENTELLLILKDNFDKYLHRFAFAELKERYLILKRLKLFQGWSKESLTRLARLGYFKAIPEKTIITRQGDQPSHFHILRKGIVKVTKTPSRFLELQEKKSQVENDIKRVETLYSYHHTLEPKHKLFDFHNQEEDDRFNNKRSKTENTRKRKPTSFERAKNYKTPTEEHLIQLKFSLQKITQSIQRLEAQCMVGKEAKIVYPVKDLLPLAYFGEECVIDPTEDCRSNGTFTTDLKSEFLRFHKVVFQSFEISDVFVSRWQAKATKYPQNLEIHQYFNENANWEKEKSRIFDFIKKTKWPISKRIIKDLGGGKQKIDDSLIENTPMFADFIA